MTVLAQRDGVRVVAFNKCGHTSIINTFMSTKEDLPNTTDRARALGGYQGDLTNFQDWPEPEVIVSFLRNPAHRALSAYHHFCVRKERYKFKELGFEFGMSFPDYVDHLLTVDLTVDAHLAPFIDDLVTAGGDRVYVLAPLELIGECWPIAMDNVGLADVPREVLHKNKGGYQAEDYMRFDLHEKLRGLYCEDYNLWETIYNEARAEISPISNATH
jgi:hypothetical protein